jgi:hypothetical protein
MYVLQEGNNWKCLLFVYIEMILPMSLIVGSCFFQNTLQQ